MEKFIFTILFFWVLWKVMKRGIDELQSRMEDQAAEQKRRTASRPPAPPSQVRTPAQREQLRPDARRRRPDREETELERLLMEAMKRKDQLEEDDEEATPLVVSEDVSPELVQPEPEEFEPPRRVERPRVARPQTTSRRVEPRRERRRQVRMEQRRMAVPRQPATARTEPRRARMLPTKPATRQVRRAAQKTARRERQELRGIGRLGKKQVRKGIIIAEILGSPKALRDTDSHVI
jgi:hypothetical protein